MKAPIFLKFMLLVIPLLACSQANAAGLMKPANSALPDLNIAEHHVDVVIEDGYVTTAIEQVFHNPNNQDLEAIYSFPVPDGAAVGEFMYWIDGKPVIAEVVGKQQARTLYQEQKAAGKRTALVEKDSYKTFDITVYPVKAGATVKTRLVYIQAANMDSGMGRYVYPLEEGGVDEEKLAFWSRNESVKEHFSFNLRFRSSYPVDALRLPKHPQATITQHSNDEWTVALVNQQNPETPTNADVITLSQDIVMYWRHQEGLPGSLDVVANKPGADARGTVMMTFTPGDDLAVVTAGSDWVFVLDISGSMKGKYATLVEGVRQGLGKLRANDRFNVVLFNEYAVDLSKGFKSVTHENITAVTQQLENYPIGGGTNLYAGLKHSLNDLDADRPAGIILVTDGVANVGKTEKKAFLALLEKIDIRLFTFVMGNSANRPLLNGMAEVSDGFALSISNADDIVGQIMLATNKLTHQAFNDVQLHIGGVKVKDLTPEDIGSLYRGEQLKVFGHYWKAGKANITLSAKIGGQKKVYKTTVALPEVSNRNPEIERLWAFAAIENLNAKLDYFGADKDTEQAMTDIALEYGLVTNHTSMIVVEEDGFEAQGIARNNKQRVEREQKARAERKAQPVNNNRADNAKPMFNSPRPLSGSGGALNPLVLLGLFMMALLSKSIRRNKSIKVHVRRR